MQVALSAFSYIFSEFVQYSQSRVDLTQELERRYALLAEEVALIADLWSSSLADAGYGIGLRVLELLSHREKASRKEKNLIAMLQFIHGTVWKSLFGKQSDGLEKSTEKDDECAFSFSRLDTDCAAICLCRLHFRQGSDHEQIHFGAERSRAFELRRFHRWHHQWNSRRR